MELLSIEMGKHWRRAGQGEHWSVTWGTLGVRCSRSTWGGQMVRDGSFRGTGWNLEMWELAVVHAMGRDAQD